MQLSFQKRHCHALSRRREELGLRRWHEREAHGENDGFNLKMLGVTATRAIR